MSKSVISKHSFDKQAACDFADDSPLDSWLKGVVKAKIEMEETVDHPRMLMGILGESLEMALRDAKFREDFEQICKLCKMGMEMKAILFQKGDLFLCAEDCEYYDKKFGIYNPD